MSILNDMLQSPHLLRRCDLQRIDGSEFSGEAFNKQVRGQDRTVLVTGAVDLGTQEAHAMPLDRDAFVSSFGHLLAGASNGRFDDLRQTDNLNVADLLSLPAYELKFFLSDESEEMHREVLKQVRPLIPPYLRDFCARPILSCGTRVTTTWFHNHDETWFLMLKGRKAWWIGDPNVSLESVRSIDPCSWLAANDLEELPAGIRFIVQQPGELLYLPDQAVHATFNIDNFTFGFGAQGHTETWPPVLQVAQRGDMDALKQLVADGAGDVDALSPAGETALQRIAWRGDLDMATLLLEQRADPNLVGNQGATALHIASEVGQAPLVDVLLSHRADPNVRGKASGQTPLHLAAKEGHIDVAKALVQSGSHSSGRSASGSEPLHSAVISGHLEVMQWLVDEESVDINSADENGATVAHYAAIQGHVDILEYALSRGADLEVVDEQGVTPMEYAVTAGHQTAVEFFFESV